MIATMPGRRPTVARSLAELRRTVARWHRAGETVALVPTMGALHAGHLSLVRLARRRADHVIVSIFVNPTQFAPHEDFSSYPRPLAADLAALATAQIGLVWAPSVATMYPPDFSTRIALAGPATAGLEDAVRPHFFSGVTTVVTKLLIQCAPDIAVFGEKDYQQLRVITALAHDLDLPVRIVGAPIKREKDGLALSSRNVYLAPAERVVAPTLYRVLAHCGAEITRGRPTAKVLASGRDEIAHAGFALDYLELRRADTLAPATEQSQIANRLLVAARLGKTRLIDNIAV
jgi:pantoate--beta-alanine ligase